MKRYLVFGGSAYYPDGGWDDFLLDTSNLEEATNKVDEYCKNSSTWAHVADSKVKKKVYYNYRSYEN